MPVQIPKFSDLLLPTLKSVAQLGGSGSISEIVSTVVDIEQFTEEQQDVLHNDGPETKIGYRVAWARTYLKYFGLLTNSARGVWAITEAGDRFLNDSALDDDARLEILRKLRAEKPPPRVHCGETRKRRRYPKLPNQTTKNRMNPTSR